MIGREASRETALDFPHQLPPLLEIGLARLSLDQRVGLLRLEAEMPAP
jgi:hypothetical protein